MKIIMKTDIGKRRVNNEDAIQTAFNQHDQPLFILCDGVGGQQFGEVASGMCVNYLTTQWQQTERMTAQELKQWFEYHVNYINSDIHRKGQSFSDLKGMSTTLVCASIDDNQLVVSHVGDSRLYIYRYPYLQQITKDHSLVNFLVDKGEITPQEALVHPMRHVITRSVGNESYVDIDFTQVTLKTHDIILLCSDGLSDMVSEEDIVKILNQGMTPYEQINNLIKCANTNGGRDNISVILAYVEQKGGE
ncbi:Stp1/IreP family PP2C-type Ser/Thr phosphatase [Carnobacteriaceae bacterium zg-ZUI240]|nr:Stp1/IreP family PP2C-type Ser/Thr phosphatase [Carnobacteriaceae bacterium zg-ZUI240]